MLKVRDYRKTVRRPYPPLQSSLLLNGFKDRKYFSPFFKHPYALTETVVVDDVWYCSDKQLDQIGRLTLDAWKNQGSFLRSKKLFLQRENTLLAMSKRNFNGFIEAYQAYQPAVLMISYSEKLLEDFVRGMLAKKLNPDEVGHMMDVLNTPVQNNFFQQEEYDLVTTKNIKQHVKKYAGLYSRYANEKVYTLQDARKKLSAINKREYLRNYHRRKTWLKTELERCRKILGKKWAFIPDVMQFSVYYRTRRADILHLAMFNSVPMTQALAKEHGYSYRQMLYCTADEIVRHHLPSKAIISARIKKHAFILENGNVRIVSGMGCQELETRFDRRIKSVSVFSGVPAQSGRAVGLVKKIYAIKDYQNFKNGQILVVSMTTPDMVPIIAKASGIITDEGGITCHAAIISRELGIPCVIGTKIATKVLHDGDMVEVDATKGIVRKL